jgi:hypothetical protein
MRKLKIQTSNTLMTLKMTPALLLNLSTTCAMTRDPTISPAPRTLRASKDATSWSLSLLSGIVLTIIVAASPLQYAIDIPVQNIYGKSHLILGLHIRLNVNLILPPNESKLVSTISCEFCNL